MRYFSLTRYKVKFYNSSKQVDSKVDEDYSLINLGFYYKKKRILGKDNRKSEVKCFQLGKWTTFENNPKKEIRQSL